ncbi:Phototropic-responsive NPH3 family protein [Perilla frutescens var. hirtella]|uniref:Phototropic-responsive NPH3 family protein n=1 Tax=Perilla frutescens var. hirtella TaxID=608512 RepID=A0AAD4J3D1_PERFH|nr:Phototropic-responsive NPH3 family protein [Perilla frutescens var. hirtella]
MKLVSLPGGAESFELAAKFCYGINFEITTATVAQLCCVSDYLEMTEEYSKNNLGSRAEEYLNGVLPKLVWSKLHMSYIFSRLEYSSSGRLHMSKQPKCEGDWWIEDISVLRVDLYQRVITAIKCRGVRPESIGASLVNYAEKEPIKKSGLWNQPNQAAVNPVSGASSNERLVVETIISLLPVEKFVVPVTFLFGMLRSAVMLDCSVSSRLDLERRIGSQLDIATLDDLLIPSFRHAGDILFDVETVHRILINFSQMDDSDEEMDEESVFESDSPTSPSQTALFKVSKLVDNYLAEIAPDANLKLNVFVAIAETLPEHARTAHDGLYRAIDIYLKRPLGSVDGWGAQFPLLTGRWVTPLT